MLWCGHLHGEGRTTRATVQNELMKKYLHPLDMAPRSAKIAESRARQKEKK